MKVSSLGPHIAVESSPVAESSEAKRTASQLGLRVVKAEEPTKNTDLAKQNILDQQTLLALRRLSGLIEKKKKTAQTRFRKGQALRCYADVLSCRDPSTERGKHVDEYY